MIVIMKKVHGPMHLLNLDLVLKICKKMNEKKSPIEN